MFLEKMFAVCQSWQQEEATTMNHQVPEELISAYFDGEVTPDERVEIELSLESSSDLRQQLDETSKLSALLHSFPRESAPRDLAANVQKQVNAAAQPAIATSQTAPYASTRRSLRREWTAFGAGMLATMASLLMFLSFHQSPFSTDSPAPSDWNDESRSYVEMQPKPAAKQALAEAQPTLTSENFNTEAAAPPEPFRRHLSLSQDAKHELRKMDDHAAGTASFEKLNEEENLAQNSESMPVNSDSIVLNSNSIHPQIQNEFLSYLANGDVIVSRVADPTNTVAVVYFTVVDIERGSNELKVLFQKRSLQEVEVSDSASLVNEHDANDRLANQQQSSTKNDLSKKQDVSRPDEFQVVFVRAPGDQLADTIDDLVKNHEDIFRNWTPQPPIELPVATQPPSEGIFAENKASAADDNKSRDKSQKQFTDETTTVNAEAEMAVSALMARNNSVNANGNFYYSYYGANPSVPLGSSNSLIGNAQNSEQKMEFGARATAAVASNSTATGPAYNMPGNNAQNSANSGQGYFRVSRQNMPHVALQQAKPSQTAGAPLVASSMLNTNLDSAGAFGGGVSRHSVVNTNNDIRNPRLVRMLFVLKSGQATTNPTP